MPWVKVTEPLLLNQPEWLYGPLWICNNGYVLSGKYKWRQGRNPDRFDCDDGQDISALNNCYIRPLIKPKPPKLQ